MRDAATGKVVGTVPHPGDKFKALYHAAQAPTAGWRSPPSWGTPWPSWTRAAAGRGSSGPTGRSSAWCSPPDGRRLLGLGRAGSVVWDLAAADAGPAARLPAADEGGFSPDGKAIALDDLGYLSVWTVGGKPVAAADPASPVYRVRFSADGKRVLGGTRAGWVAWPAGGGPGARLSDGAMTNYDGMADVSADGRVGVDVLFEPGPEPGRGRVRPPGDRPGDWGGPPRPPRPGPVGPDPRQPGRAARVGRARRPGVRGLGREDGRPVAPGEAEPAGPHPAGGRPDLGRQGGGPVRGRGLDPGRRPRPRAGLQGDRRDRPPAGREWKLDPVPWSVYSDGVRFGPDGTRLVVQGHLDRDWKRDSVSVWDAGTGRRLVSVSRPAGRVAAATLAADGRGLLVGDPDGKLALVEVATGEERAAFRHGGEVLSAAFSPDGTRAVSSSPEAPVYVWDLLGAPGRWDPAKADAVWADLASADAKAGFAAMRKLRANPAEAVAFLKDRVKPPVVPTDETIAGWLKGLDAPAFADREKAQRDLAAVADLVRPKLEAARKTASAEAARRLDQVLKAADGLTADQLRQVRACEVLEGVGTADAVRVLKAWAGRPAGGPADRRGGRVPGPPPPVTAAVRPRQGGRRNGRAGGS